MAGFFVFGVEKSGRSLLYDETNILDGTAEAEWESGFLTGRTARFGMTSIYFAFSSETILRNAFKVFQYFWF